jgi:hypothetical protein
MTDAKRNPIQWQLTGPAGAVRTGQAFGLKNTAEGKSIAYGARDNGINLAWDGKNAGGNITLARASGVKDAVKHGEFLAMNVKGGKYLRYQKRDTGVNLGWSDTPVEEWQIVGGKLGEPVQVGQPFTLKNKIEDDLLVYAVRAFGINLRWENEYRAIGDESLTAMILDRGVDAAMNYAENFGVPEEVTGLVGAAAKAEVKALS